MPLHDYDRFGRCIGKRRFNTGLLPPNTASPIATSSPGRDKPEHVNASLSYHNAWTEPLNGTLKSEMLQGGCFLDHKDARTEIFAYVESYYNSRKTFRAGLSNSGAV